MEQINPLEQPAPDDGLKRIHAFAYDLAWAMANDIWLPTIWHSGGSWWIEDSGEFDSYKKTKWENSLPEVDIMLSFNYMEVAWEDDRHQKQYRLTEKAYALLEKPPQSPSIFISYKRSESSVLALYIQARLRVADSSIGVFVDKEIPSGTRFEQVLKDRIESAEYMVCLLAQESLESEWVRKEIKQALEQGKKIIPISHLGYSLSQSTSHDDNEIAEMATALSTWQEIKVREHSAEGYEVAINRLLVDLGYQTY